MEKTTDSLLLFPCPGCNAQLYYEPGAQQLNCTYCGTNVPIKVSTEPVKESDLQSFLKWEGEGTEAVEQHTYKFRIVIQHRNAVVHMQFLQFRGGEPGSL
jgi:LSD1 subclass zinc finger protein